MKAIALIVGAGLVATGAIAKLPDPSPEAKAKADLTKAENAHKDRVAAFQLCKSQNATATRHLAAAGKGKGAALPACEDPGKFVPPEPAPLAIAAAVATAAPVKQ